MQGGTSPLPGSVELMLHRRLLDDDAFGKCLDEEEDNDDDDDDDDDGDGDGDGDGDDDAQATY